MQAANVQDIIGNAQDVDQVVHAVDFAGALIDDLDQSLDVLGQKLKHMRTDITAIEARNNSLQVWQPCSSLNIPGQIAWPIKRQQATLRTQASRLARLHADVLSCCTA